MNSSEAQSAEIWKTARKHPRISLTIPVELRVGETKTMTNTLNLSVGGMLLQPQQKPLSLGTELEVVVHLPTGPIAATAKVVHLTTMAKVVHLMGSAVGLQFTDLDETSRLALSKFLRRMITYVRRGVRLTRRMPVTVRSVGSPDAASEMAETIVICRHGGLLSTRANFAAEDRIFLWWPDGKRGINARIVHRRGTGTAGVFEMGFEFLQDFNFWGLDFPEESHI